MKENFKNYWYMIECDKYREEFFKDTHIDVSMVDKGKLVDNIGEQVIEEEDYFSLDQFLLGEKALSPKAAAGDKSIDLFEKKLSFKTRKTMNFD